VFGMRVRRSGSMRGRWHRREKKRLPAELRPVVPPPPTPQTPFPNEAQWLSGDPQRMVRCVVRLATDRRIVFPTTAPQVARKLRLYFCACARHRWDLLPDDVRQIVGVIERHAEGRESSKALRAARAAVRIASRASQPTWSPDGYEPGAWERYFAVAVVVSAAEVREQLQAWGSGSPSWPTASEQAALLHDLFDNPFRPTELDPRWYTSDVVRLAGHIRAERAFELMPILGDALQDAGCDSTAVLEHCYGGCRRVPGCWLVDALAHGV
jgi:hypothetical protein